MKKFEQGILQNAEVGQSVRILSGKMADYNKVWTITRISEEGHRILKTATERKVFWEMEAQTIEVEIA